MTREDEAVLRALLDKATPLNRTTRFVRYDHGGGRWFNDGEAGERVLIADFYNAGDRELFYALRTGADAHLAALTASRAEADAMRAAARSLLTHLDNVSIGTCCVKAAESLRALLPPATEGSAGE